MQPSPPPVDRSIPPFVLRAIALIGLLAAGAGAQEPLFPVPLAEAGDYLRDVVLVDLDGDGALDAVTSSGGAGSAVNVVLGDGAGGFGPPADLPTADYPFVAAVGDLDADGSPDLVCQNNMPQTVSAFMGLGGGSFAPGLSYPAGDQAEDVLLADMDEDGDVDALVAGFSGTLAFLAGDGTGAFLAPALSPVPAGAVRVAAGDLDLDGHLDAAVCTVFTNLIVITLGDGHGALSGSVSYATGPVQRDIELGDLDGNGLLDVATLHYGGALTVLLATSPGTYAPTPELALLPCSGIEYQSAEGLAVDDLDRDGHLDLLATSGECGEVQVFAGDGAGAFAPPVVHVVGDDCLGLDVGDVDGDGALDVAVATTYVSLAVLRGDGTGGLVSGQRIDLPGTAAGLVAADVDADGAPDVVTALFEESALAVLSGLAEGGLGPPALQPLAAGSAPAALALVDLDGDGDADAVVSDELGGQALVALGDGQGAFAAQGALVVGTLPVGVTAADFDENGSADAALALWGDDAVRVLLGDGAGGWSASATYGVGDSPNAVAAADLDTDGHADLAAANYGSDTLSLLFGNGLGAFVAAPSLGTGDEPLDVVAIDADDDGDLDLLVAQDASPGSVGLLRGDGSGSFAAVEVLEFDGYGASAATGGDVDGNGVTDLIASGSGAVVVLAGSGTGSFAPAVRFASNSAYDLALLDVDRDGALDAATTGVEGSLRLLLNSTSTPWQTLPGGLAGGTGVPVLTGTGELIAGTLVTLELTGALPASTAYLVVGLAAANLPFKGGVLVPSADLVVSGIPTSPAGGVALHAGWPSGVPSGLLVYLQEWVHDAGAPKGFAATNGLSASVP